MGRAVKSQLTWFIRWACACPRLLLAAPLRRLPRGRRLAVPPVPLPDPQARGATVPAMRCRAGIGAQGLWLPRAAQVAGSAALGRGVRGTHRARRTPLQVRRVDATRRPPRPAPGGTTGGGGARGPVRGGGAAPS